MLSVRTVKLGGELSCWGVDCLAWSVNCQVGGFQDHGYRSKDDDLVNDVFSYLVAWSDLSATCQYYSFYLHALI